MDKLLETAEIYLREGKRIEAQKILIGKVHQNKTIPRKYLTDFCSKLRRAGKPESA